MGAVVDAENPGRVSTDSHCHMLPVAVMRAHLQPHAAHVTFSVVGNFLLSRLFCTACSWIKDTQCLHV